MLNKLLALFGKLGGVLGLSQAIILPQTLRYISRVKNSTDSKIEVVFHIGTHNVESVAMVAQNVSEEEDIMSVAPIPEYLVYDGFKHNTIAALVYESIWDIQHGSPMRYHALMFLCSCVVVT